MKTTKRMIVVGIALAFAITTWSATPVLPGSARGGAGDLVKQGTPATQVTQTAMVCPKCKSEWLLKTDLTARGATKPAYLTEKHLCGKCGTELKTSGTGKQAKQLAVHVCGNCSK